MSSHSGNREEDSASQGYTENAAVTLIVGQSTNSHMRAAEQLPAPPNHSILRESSRFQKLIDHKTCKRNDSCSQIPPTFLGLPRNSPLVTVKSEQQNLSTHVTTRRACWSVRYGLDPNKQIGGNVNQWQQIVHVSINICFRWQALSQGRRCPTGGWEEAELCKGGVTCAERCNAISSIWLRGIAMYRAHCASDASGAGTTQTGKMTFK